MKNTNNWVGIISLIFSCSVFAGDIEISDAWIRVNAQDQENAMVGLTVTSPKKARIIAVRSTAYAATEMRRLSKAKGKLQLETKTSIPLPANQPLRMGADNYHFALLGKLQTLKAGEKVAVVLTLQHSNKETSDITFLAQPVRSRAGSLPVQLISEPVKSPVNLPANKAQIITPESSPAIVTTPVLLQAPPETALTEPVAITEPISEPTPVSIAEPAPAPEPIPAPLIQPAPVETSSAEQIKDDEPLVVDDCVQFQTAMNNCDLAGELDDIIKCRKKVKARLACSQPN